MSTKTRTDVKTSVVTRADVRTSIGMGRLTEEEERIVRMRHGISEGPSAKLTRRGQEFDETRVRLALIEAEAVNQLMSDRNSTVKDRIIARLKNMG